VVEVEWEKGKIQTTFLALGVDAEVPYYQKNESSHGFIHYIRASWVALIRSKPAYDLICKIDGKEEELHNCVNFTLGKVPYYGYSIRSLVGEIPSNDGNVHGLAVVNTHAVYLNKIARIWGLILSSLNLEKHPLVKFAGKKFEIKSGIPFPFVVGGDFVAFTTWIKVRIKRKQKVLVI